MAKALTIQEDGAGVRLTDGMPLDISRHQHLVDLAKEDLRSDHLSFPRQLAMAAASVHDALGVLPDLADAVLDLLPTDTDGDKARAVLQGMRPFLNQLADSGTKLSSLALLAVAEGLPGQRTAIAGAHGLGGGLFTARGKS